MRSQSFIDQPQKWLKPTHRTLSEQILGFFIFLGLCSFFFMFHMMIARPGLTSPWYLLLNKTPWIMDKWAENYLWLIFYFIPSVSTWLVWRRISIFKIKLEISLYLAFLAFQACWLISFFLLKLPLLSLFAQLFGFIALILHGLVLYKNEPKSKILLALILGWMFYVTGVNMAFCVTNP